MIPQNQIEDHEKEVLIKSALGQNLRMMFKEIPFDEEKWHRNVSLAVSLMYGDEGVPRPHEVSWARDRLKGAAGD